MGEQEAGGGDSVMERRIGDHDEPGQSMEEVARRTAEEAVAVINGDRIYAPNVHAGVDFCLEPTVKIVQEAGHLRQVNLSEWAPVAGKPGVDEFVRLATEVDALEAALKEAKRRRDEQEAQALDYFSNEGLQNLRTKAGVTVYLAEEWWAGTATGASMETVVAKLQEVLPDLAEDWIKPGVSMSTLKAWLKEREIDLIEWRQEVEAEGWTPEEIKAAEAFKTEHMGFPREALREAVAWGSRYRVRVRGAKAKRGGVEE